jgi:hypothetical protein
MNDVPHLRVTSSLVINQECTLLDTGLEEVTSRDQLLPTVSLVFFKGTISVFKPIRYPGQYVRTSNAVLILPSVPQDRA